MIHEAALWVGYAVLVSGAVIGAGATLFGIWWFAADRVVEHFWGMKLVFEVAARILKERKAADRNQLTRFPPKDKAYDQ